MNSEKTIIKLIETVNNQTYKNIEHIFIDGHSIDKTKEIIFNKSKYKFFIQQTSLGIYGAMNEGIKNSKGDILVFIGSDDFLSSSDILEKVALEFDNATDIVFGNIQYYDFKKKKRHWRSFNSGEYYKGAYSKGWHAPHPAFFIKKDSILELFDESCKISADLKFMFYHQEILQLKSKHINQIIVNMGRGGTSQKFKNIILGNMNIIKALNNYYKINPIFFLIKRFIFKLNATL